MKVQQGERDFDQISKTIRKEVSRFEVRRSDGLMGEWKEPVNVASTERCGEWIVEWKP